MKAAEVCVNHQVQVNVQSQHIESIAKGIFLYADIIEFNKFLGKKNGSAINDDAMSRRMGKFVKNVRANSNTSMLNSSSGFLQYLQRIIK